MEDTRQDKQDAQRVLLIKETIATIEKQLQTAKSLIAQLESKYTPQKKTYGVAEGGKVIEGTFDGQVMIGTDGRQYPVPANYASKSKLVEGDMLKLVITDDGNFIYKQIGPFKRKRIIGILRQNQEEGGYEVVGEGNSYKVLLAAVTYHHASPGDEIALIVADTEEARWGAIENVLKKGEPGGKIESGDKSFELKGENEEDFEPSPPKNVSPPKVLSEESEEEKDVKKKKPKKEKKAEEPEEDSKISKEGKIEKEAQPKAKIISEEEIEKELAPDLKEVEKELKNQLGE